MVEKNIYEGLGRPKKGSLPIGVSYFVTASIVRDENLMKEKLDRKSCYVIGSNVADEQLTAVEVITAYKSQNASIENMGFRFLKGPIFFASSLFLKKPSRIMGLLMVMTLALLVYSIAQRRMRCALENSDETLPNQINKQTKKPTMRWIFQLMDGIHLVKIKVGRGFKTMIHGVNELKRKIIDLMGGAVGQIYCSAKCNSGCGGSSM